MNNNRSLSIEKIGRSIYPLRILGFLLFGISIVLSYSKLGMKIDAWALIGIIICLIYPHVIFIRYIRKNEKRDVEIKHMLFDMGVQGVMAALVSFNPSVVLPYLIANSAANYALRGIQQTLKAVAFSIFTALLIGLLRNKEIDLEADPVELIAPFIYLTAVIHYMGYLAYVRGLALIRRKKEAEKLAQVDFLTGLNNRRSMFDQVKLNNDETTVILIDLDHFKQINDIHGHDHGDAVLVRISQLLKSSLRETDVVSRWGGEEFLVLLPKTNINQGLKLAETIRKNIADDSISYGDTVHHVAATLGVTTYGTNVDFEQSIKYADEALYEGKKQGRNRVVQIKNSL
jgi:diguanylate cyclase (GGDEF)-like protein